MRSGVTLPATGATGTVADQRHAGGICGAAISAAAAGAGVVGGAAERGAGGAYGLGANQHAERKRR